MHFTFCLYGPLWVTFCEGRKVCVFLFLFVDVQLFCLLKRLSSIHCIAFAPLSKMSWPYLCGSVYMLSVLIYLLIYLSIPSSIIHCLDYCSFTILSLPIHEHGISLHLFSSLISFIRLCSFPLIDLFFFPIILLW